MARKRPVGRGLRTRRIDVFAQPHAAGPEAPTLPALPRQTHFTDETRNQEGSACQSRIGVFAQTSPALTSSALLFKSIGDSLINGA
jgi:hypothetical protein